MSYLPNSKWGDCTQCPAKNVACVKIKKDLVCCECNNRNKAIEQADKAKKRTAARFAGTKVRNLVEENLDIKAPKDYAELDRWFKDRQKEMTGRCLHCNGKTEAYTKLFKCSIAHILPKAYFKSVATHPDNWIELCFYGKSCHTNLDNHIIDLMELNCFDTIIQKFVRIYPFIAPDEKRRIPDVLLQYIEVEK